MTTSLPQPTSPDNDTTPYPTVSAVDISPLTHAFGTGLMDYGLAYVCTAIAGVSILGLEPFAFMNSWATNLVDQANAAIEGAASAVASSATISAGVTSNITGATATTASDGVGPAVQLLNATVQASGTAPRIDIYNTSATWNKQSGMTTGQIMLVGGGGGGARGGMLAYASGSAGGGGGPAGYSIYSGITAGSLPSSAAVVVPLGGSGGGGGVGNSFDDDFNRSNALSLGGSWRTDSGTQSNQILNNAAQAYTPSTYVGETASWNTWATPLATDNYIVEAQLSSPTTSLATNNYSGVYCAAPTTYSSSTVLVAFVGTTGGGCKIFTQANAPSGAFIANGSQTGQTVVASSSTPFTVTSKIALTRNGNIFTGWINGVSVCTWTDTGNTVPTGSGNRLWGIINETNWPTFQSLYNAPAINEASARDVSWLSQPGTDGGTASFNGSAYQVTGGKGGVGGGTDSGGTRRPATGSILNTDPTWTGAAGTGNLTNNASGGLGAAGVTGYSPAGTAGGGGLNTGGGVAGNSSALHGSAGTSPGSGVYGPGSGGGGGFYVPIGSSATAGQGGSGGFPGGGGAGGGATQDGLGANGFGGPGGDGQVVVTSFFT